MKRFTFRLFFLAASFLLASFIPAAAGNGQKKPKQKPGSLSCPVNASAGKRASARPTQIRKKNKSGKMKPAKNIRREKSGNVSPRSRNKSSQQRQSKNRSFSGNQRGGGISGGANGGGNFPQQRSSPPVKR